jgi:hypothetical protein
MSNTAYQIWETFKAELIVEPTDDMKEALAAAIREIVNEFQYYQCCEEEGVEDMVVDARVLYELATELEELND